MGWQSWNSILTSWFWQINLPKSFSNTRVYPAVGWVVEQPWAMLLYKAQRKSHGQNIADTQSNVCVAGRLLHNQILITESVQCNYCLIVYFGTSCSNGWVARGWCVQTLCDIMSTKGYIWRSSLNENNCLALHLSLCRLTPEAPEECSVNPRGYRLSESLVFFDKIIPLIWINVSWGWGEVGTKHYAVYPLVLVHVP